VIFSTTKMHFPRFSLSNSKNLLLFGVPSVLHIEISVPHISFGFFEPKSCDCDFLDSENVILRLVMASLFEHDQATSKASPLTPSFNPSLHSYLLIAWFRLSILQNFAVGFYSQHMSEDSEAGGPSAGTSSRSERDQVTETYSSGPLGIVLLTRSYKLLVDAPTSLSFYIQQCR